ncbi:hypothetical protein SNOG_16294 [Parastagonospora nodorum SN15]|uniref:Uncharacterized protein n=1 Tax=Phaeosphaeria nodorum (strain SN15 / ATCC MYA-4574 / FGSC 10173) TaxID=321614 RepID=Q0TVX5_PHANO|nr:hypothetical protein SNOG_16294 [Parastagonospora nodorum SN15]EAT76280.1 hypothetical protein SNOG_16294 [Parastagonospora nodorum SN15]
MQKPNAVGIMCGYFGPSFMRAACSYVVLASGGPHKLIRKSRKVTGVNTHETDRDHRESETEDCTFLILSQEGNQLQHGILPRQQTSPGEMIILDVSWRADETKNKTVEVLFYAQRAQPTRTKLSNEFFTTPSLAMDECCVIARIVLKHPAEYILSKFLYMISNDTARDDLFPPLEMFGLVFTPFRTAGFVHDETAHCFPLSFTVARRLYHGLLTLPQRSPFSDRSLGGISHNFRKRR